MFNLKDGKLIVIEGLDGSGKATQTGLLAQTLRDGGVNVQTAAFPNYDSKSSTFVKMYLAGELGGLDDVNVYAASSFYSIDRYVSYRETWAQAYRDADLFLCDRYTTSNISHQMSKLPREEWDSYLDWLYDFEFTKLQLPRPQLVIYLDMPPEVSAKLILARYAGDESKKDLHEQNTAYLEKCREAALYAAARLGWHVVDCSENGEPHSIEKIAQIIWQVLNEYLEV